MKVEQGGMVEFEWVPLDNYGEIKFTLPDGVELIAKVKDNALEIRNVSTDTHKTCISVKPNTSNVILIEGIAW